MILSGPYSIWSLVFVYGIIIFYAIWPIVIPLLIQRVLKSQDKTLKWYYFIGIAIALELLSWKMFSNTWMD